MRKAAACAAILTSKPASTRARIRDDPMRKWLPMIILASAQFVMVLDSSVMNVAISQIVADLDTTIQGVQTAITLYTLVMAAFMLLGAKLGDILGTNRSFAIGLAIYGVGSLTTALAPNLGVLLIGWSGVEGFGAVLVVPAIAALTAASYTGRERALAYALLGGIAAIAVAAGPLIGGWVTTEFTWRYVFAAETVVVIVILLLRRQITRAPAPERRPKLDIVGVALSSAGLGLIVFAILRSSVWGFVQPRTSPEINGTEITPLGFSVVPFMVLGGLALLWAFTAWEQRRSRTGRDELLDTTLLRIAQLRAGLATLVGQQLVLMGAFFVIPVYLQVVLGLDAFETGKRLLPLSVAMLVSALLGPRMAARRSSRTVAQVGLVAVSIGAVVMLATLDVKLNETGFKVALALVGAGAGLLASQLGNVIMSSVEPAKSSEAGGLQGTAQNLGSSLGTAIIGAVLLASLATGFSERIVDNSALPAAARQAIVANVEQGIDIVPVTAVEEAATKGGATPEQATAIADDYGEAQLDALRLALGAVAVAALLSLWFTRRLPTTSLAESESGATEPVEADTAPGESAVLPGPALGA
jgi:MFS family permease